MSIRSLRHQSKRGKRVKFMSKQSQMAKGKDNISSSRLVKDYKNIIILEPPTYLLPLTNDFFTKPFGKIKTWFWVIKLVYV